MNENELIINKDQIHKIPKHFMDQAHKFRSQMMIYECAIKEITTKLEVLNLELSIRKARNPIATIQSRIKKPDSIVSKMIKEQIPLSIENIEKHLYDVAGVRLICSYIDDIYKVYDMLQAQDDIEILDVRDYIENPKPSGYRSLHIIVQIPVFLSTGKVLAKVEVQIRTIAMDFWASLEHGIRYKKDLENIASLAEDLQKCAETIAETDLKMMQIRHGIELLEDENS